MNAKVLEIEFTYGCLKIAIRGHVTEAIQLGYDIARGIYRGSESAWRLNDLAYDSPTELELASDGVVIFHFDLVK